MNKQKPQCDFLGDTPHYQERDAVEKVDRELRKRPLG